MYHNWNYLDVKNGQSTQFQFMWDLEPELLIFLYDLVYHGMPFFGTAIISWGVGCMWGEEWMSWALMLGLGTSWLSRTRCVVHAHSGAASIIMTT